MLIRFLLFLLLCTPPSYAKGFFHKKTQETTSKVTPESPKRTTICLNMIVKDESHVIQRCLDSVKPIIDYWVIVDTGSTDGTQEIIKKHLKGIPGKLHHRPWVNFEHNRNEALQLAKESGDYLLFMDADDILEFEPDFKMPSLIHDLYNMWRGSKEFSYIKPQLVKANLPWKWVGVTHEYLGCDYPYTSDILQKVRYTGLDDGATRSDPKKKFLKNVQLLEDGLKKEPNNERYVFYLAESYYDAGEKAKALEWYQKRVDMGRWPEEVFWSLLRIGHCLRFLGIASNVVIESYALAHQYRPHRVEPIYYIAEMYNMEGNYIKAYEWLKKREAIPQPLEKDSLFNEDWMEDYGLLFQLSLCSYYIGFYQESLEACDKLLSKKHLPEALIHQIKINRTYPLASLRKKN